MRPWLAVSLAAGTILMIVMGGRQTLGLFVSPLNTSTGLGIVAISFAMAVGQFVWGAVQPLTGALADRYGPERVLAGGVVLLAIGTAVTPFMSGTLGLVMTIGIVTAIGAGACSFSVLIGAVSRRLPVDKRGTAAGIINAGSSLGQFVFSPPSRWRRCR
jgi:MFS family permease